jgi:hypothetical protein
MENQLPDLYPLSPLQIQQLINDLRLVNDEKAKVFFAIDPFELMSFCFPIHLSDDSSVDIKTLADDQAALYEIFYRQNALLLSEYDHEMDRSLYFYENMTSDRFRDKAEMVDRIIKEGEKIWGTFPAGDIDENAEFLKKNFSVILAIAMGTFNVGITRLRDVYDLRLIKGDFTRRVQREDLPEVRRILGGYQRTEYWEVIKKHLQPFWDDDELKTKQQLRSIEVDASAIDRIIYLNSSFEEARLKGDLSVRYLVNYLSSAKRTARVFADESAVRFLPIVNGEPYHFWRTRQQIFAYVVHKSRKNDHDESIANLEQVRDILDEVNKFEGLFSSQDCVDCVLKTGLNASGSANGASVSDCRWRDFCTKVKGLDDAIQQTRTQVQNLGLINTLQDYEKLLRAKPAGASQKQYLDFFRKTFNSPLARQAQMKMETLQQWILVKSEFTNSFTEALGINSPEFDHSSLRSPEDFVTGSGQYLPTKPRVSGGSYKQILHSILGFYRNPTNFDQVENAYKRYVELDTESRDTDREIDLEHELIRCFLYLALPRNNQNTESVASASSGDQKAYQHAESLMEGDQLIARTKWDETPEAIKQEFRYVQCWAARRIGHFRKAVALAKEGSEKEPTDPRFFHGLCLAIYSWLVKNPNDSPPRLEEAIEATKKAISLYKSQSTAHENDDVIAANYNNLAYFLAWSVELAKENEVLSRQAIAEQNRQTLAEAREALDSLRGLIKKSTWEQTKHPEYFHTEAYLEYVEFMVAISAVDFATARRKLENANREIGIAIPLLAEGPTKEKYRALRDQIQQGLKMLKS